MRQAKDLRRIRAWIAIFVVGLISSGITAFPLQTEVNGLLQILHREPLQAVASSTGLLRQAWGSRIGVGELGRDFTDERSRRPS